MRVTPSKRVLIIAGAMLGVLLLQGTVINRFTFLGVRPDLVLVVVGSVALARGWAEGLVWGITGGLLEDILSGSLPGSRALAKGVTGFILGLVEGTVFKENPLLPAVALFAGTLVDEVLFFLAAGTFGQVKWTFVTALRRVMLPNALVTAAFAPFLYRYFAELFTAVRFTQRERSRG
jgi:rod shape-determining protein MreD